MAKIGRAEGTGVQPEPKKNGIMWFPVGTDRKKQCGPETSGEDCVPPDEVIETVLQKSIFLISLLSQFKIPRVQNDFRERKFHVPERLRLHISEINAFCKAVLPYWVSSAGPTVEKKLKQAQLRLVSVANESSQQLLLADEINKCCFKPRTFKEWNEILGYLGDDAYWSETSLHKLDEVQNSGFNQRMQTSGNKQINNAVIIRKDASTNTSCHENINVETSATGCQMNNGTSLDSKLTLPKSSKKLIGISHTVSENFPDSELKCVAPLSEFAAADCQIINQAALVHVTACDESEVSPGPDGGHMILTCSWCHLQGHAEITCWRKLGLCLICGGKHRLINCVRYKPRETGAELKCPVCGKDHLGKHCKRLMRKLCNWCGKHNHDENICYRRLCLCFLCGDTDHKMDNCQLFQRSHASPPPMYFPPWCIKCCSQHLGNDCNSPYME